MASIDKVKKVFVGLTKNPSGKKILEERNQNIQFEVGKDIGKSLSLTKKKGDEFFVVKIKKGKIVVTRGKIPWPPPKKPYPTREFLENTWIKVNRDIFDRLLGYEENMSPIDAYYQQTYYVSGMNTRPDVVSWIHRMFRKIQELKLALK